MAEQESNPNNPSNPESGPSKPTVDELWQEHFTEEARQLLLDAASEVRAGNLNREQMLEKFDDFKDLFEEKVLTAIPEQFEEAIRKLDGVEALLEQRMRSRGQVNNAGAESGDQSGALDSTPSPAVSTEAMNDYEAFVQNPDDRFIQLEQRTNEIQTELSNGTLSADDIAARVTELTKQVAIIKEDYLDSQGLYGGKYLKMISRHAGERYLDPAEALIKNLLDVWRTDLSGLGWYQELESILSINVDRKSRKELEQLQKDVSENELDIISAIDLLYSSVSSKQQSVLDSLKTSLQDKKSQISNKIEEITYRPLPEPKNMTLQEIMDELSSTIFRSNERREAVNNEYLLRKEEEADYLKQSKNQLKVGLMAAEAAGDTIDNKDWASRYRPAIDALADSSVTFQEMYAGLFLEPKANGVEATDIDVTDGNLKVDARATQVHDYIVARLRHCQEGGIQRSVVSVNGQYQDNTNGYIPIFPGESSDQYQARLETIYSSEVGDEAVTAQEDKGYSYKNVAGSRTTREFEQHLKLVFSDLHQRDPDKFDLVMRFSRLSAKTEGFIPYLMRGLTRRHGAIKGEDFKDEIRFLNPYALSIYDAARYSTYVNARYNERFIYTDREQFLEIIEEFDSSKLHHAEVVYDVMEKYLLARWGEIPRWILESKKMFGWDGQGRELAGEPEIDLDGVIFPTLPKLVQQVAKIELHKQELLTQLENNAIGDEQFIEAVNAVIKKYYPRGYSSGSVPSHIEPRSSNLDKAKSALEKFGRQKFATAEINISQYDLASSKMEEMLTKFDKEFPEMNHETAIHECAKWRSGIIGKAKLIPGDHQLLFAPLTCDLIIQLCNANYRHCKKHRIDNYWQEVSRLYRELRTEVLNAPGLPSHTKSEVKRLLGEKVPDCIVERKRPVYARAYAMALPKLEYIAEPGISVPSITKQAVGFLTGENVRGEADILEAPYVDLEKKTDTTPSGKE